MTDFVTHSLLKTFRRCPRAALYKYHDSLAPRTLSKPLKRGTWIHALLEAEYSGADWKEMHRHLSEKFAMLLDEEKDALGDLPFEMLKLMRSYLWHYRNDADWTVHEVEFKLEAELPNGIQWQGKSDMLVEDDYGLWVVDHKSNQVIPSHTHRVLDMQSVLYLWACHQNNIPVKGFIWNYLRTNGPKPVNLTLAGNLRKNQGATDFPTAVLDLKRQGINWKEDERVKPFVENLARSRFKEGREQNSPFFIRTVMEKNDDMVNRVLREASHTAERFMAYPFEDRDAVERVQEKSCDWCGFRNLCTTELIGGNTSILIRKEYTKEDPFGYYDPHHGGD